MKKYVVLICRSVRFNSFMDKDSFFCWIKKIKSIVKYDGVYKELYLYVKGKNIPEADLRGLIGLFDKYGISMKQLAIFLNKKNKRWFARGKKDEKGYWYDPIFEKKLNLKEAAPMLRAAIVDEDDKALQTMIGELKKLGYTDRAICNKIAEIKNLIKRKGDIPSFYWSRDGKGPE